MSGIEVTGGAAGLSVHLDDLEVVAGRLREVAGDLLDLGVAIGLLAADPALVVAGVLAPVELSRAEGAIIGAAGPVGAVGLSAEVGATAVATDLAVDAYRRGEDAVEALSDDVATSIATWVGTGIGAAIAPAAVVGVGAAPLAAAALSVPGAREAALGVGLGLGEEVDEILFDHPWLVPAAADGLDGLVIGLGRGAPALGMWMRWRTGHLGAAYPPRTRAEALDVVLAATRGVVLDESDHGVRVRAHEPRTVPAPRSVSDLVAHDGPTSGGDQVRVTGIPGPDGTWRWIVDIPGTQTFDPRAGTNPWDMTSNVLLSAGEQTLTMRAAAVALTDARRRAGAPPGGEVMVAGHSQGGLTAAALAANPTFRERFDVTHVVTSGAPIARAEIPSDVSVLSLEHEQDLVPGLDGAENPDRESWVTVSRDLEDELGADGRSTGAHRLRDYTDTAGLVDASDHPSVRAWREGADPFLGGEGEAVVIDYDIDRVAR